MPEQKEQYSIAHNFAIKFKATLVYAGKLNRYEFWTAKHHSHDFAEILFVAKGKGHINAFEKQWNIKKGDLIVYNKGISHAEFSNKDDPLELYFIALDKVKINSLDDNCIIDTGKNFIFESGNMYETFYKYFKIIVEESEKKDKFYSAVVQNASQTLLIFLFRLLNKEKNSYELTKQNNIIKFAVEYIDNNFLSQISLDDIASNCYVNKYYLSHLFTKYYSMSIGKYIYDKRIAFAKELLLETNNSVSKISEMAAFNNQSYFCKAFKKTEGITPLQFRKKNKKTDAE